MCNSRQIHANEIPNLIIIHLTGLANYPMDHCTTEIVESQWYTYTSFTCMST